MPDAPLAEPARRARLSPEERRAQLVALGVAALAERPLEELSIDALSAQAGVSRGLLFHYFGSKQGFQRELVTTARDAMLHATEPRADLAPLARLTDTLERTVAFVRDHGGTFHSLVRGPASGSPETRAVVEQARMEQTDRVTALFIERGVPITPELRIALRAWLAFVEQVLVDAALGSDLPANEIVALLQDALHGIVSAADLAAARAVFNR